jgi:hypothetical protein
MGVTVLTESRWWTCESSGAQEDLANSRSRTAVTRVKQWGTRMEYTTHKRVWWIGPQNHRWRVYGFGPQNPDGGSEEERTACGGIEEFASRRSYLMKSAVAVG